MFLLISAIDSFLLLWHIHITKQAFKSGTSTFCRLSGPFLYFHQQSWWRRPAKQLWNRSFQFLTNLTSNSTSCCPFSNSPNNSKTSSLGFEWPNLLDSALNECLMPSTLWVFNDLLTQTYKNCEKKSIRNRLYF